MKNRVRLLVLLMFCCAACSKSSSPGPSSSGVITYDPVAVTKSNSMKIYVHYMPWFETKESSGNNQWGTHWTMANQNPDIISSDGRRQIASYYYPNIGPYASGDNDVIEYHLLLMKYAGIDGVIVDWYGAHDVNDYALIRKNTEALATLIGKTGLQFAIDYEDRTVSEDVAKGAASSNVDAAQDDLLYLQTKFFGSSSYIKLNNTPLLLTFGPTTIQTESDWNMVLGLLSTKPCFLTLWNESGDAGKNASGEYAWVWKDNSSLDNFYTNRMPNIGIAMGSAYSGFTDFYTAGGWSGNALGWTINPQNGATFDATLQKAKQANVKYLQLVTWNDFGEGTMIEPTREFGNLFLEKLQTFTGMTANTKVFDDIARLYNMRKKCKGKVSAQTSLDQAFYYFVSLKQDKASHVLDSLQIVYP